MSETQQTTTQIAEYSATAAALTELHAKYDKVLFPVETPKGMKDAIAARKELRDLRVGLEKMRKEIKAPALLRCKLIDSEANEITLKLTALEDPIDAQIKAEEKRKDEEKAERERVERERVEAIRVSINGINNLPLLSANDSAAEIAETIADLQALDIDDSYAEFKGEAETAKQAALMALGSLQIATKAREEESARLKAEREELDRQRAELDRQRAEIEAAKAPEPEPLFGVNQTIDAPEVALEKNNTARAILDAGDIALTIGALPLDYDLAATVDAPESTVELVSIDAENGIKRGQAPDIDANDLVSEFAGYTAMQFLALADKVAAIGYADFAAQIRKDGEEIASGQYNEQIKVADWNALAEADKRMALASHACVAVLEGDVELGPSVIRQQAA